MLAIKTTTLMTEKHCFLEYDAVYHGKTLSMFRKNLLLSSSGCPEGTYVSTSRVL
jgi:hypothetical protein